MQHALYAGLFRATIRKTTEHVPKANTYGVTNKVTGLKPKAQYETTECGVANIIYPRRLVQL